MAFPLIDWCFLKRLSEKEFPFRQEPSDEYEPCNHLHHDTEGVVRCGSGRLAICEATNLLTYVNNTDLARDSNAPPVQSEKGGEKTIHTINLNSPSFEPPGLMQGDNFVAFRNNIGDGMFEVYDSNGSFYVRTDTTQPMFEGGLEEAVRELRAGRFSKEVGGTEYMFQGFVGICGGQAAIVDPELHEVVCPDPSRYMSTVLHVTPGQYVCKFTENTGALQIQRTEQ